MTPTQSPRSTLDDSRVSSTLERLFRDEDANDPALMERIHALVIAKGGIVDDSDPDVSAALKNAYISVSRDAGRLLYILARATNARHVVEFGTSYGISTIFLASAVRDNGGGLVVTTEQEPEKARRANEHFAEAGVLDLVELREGDARLTLGTLETPIDLLFLDGWKALYLPLLQVVERRLRPGSLIIADDLDVAREAMAPFLAYVRTSPRYRAVEIPLGDAMEVAVFVG